jgi:hypothetical protein
MKEGQAYLAMGASMHCVCCAFPRWAGEKCGAKNAICKARQDGKAERHARKPTAKYTKGAAGYL